MKTIVRLFDPPHVSYLHIALVLKVGAANRTEKLLPLQYDSVTNQEPQWTIQKNQS